MRSIQLVLLSTGGNVLGFPLLSSSSSSLSSSPISGFSKSSRVPKQQKFHCNTDNIPTKIMASSDATTTNDENGLFLFDFDGVVCDSCNECTVSAVRTCQKLGVLSSSKEEISSGAPPEWLFEKMREIRPAIEVGWQIPVLLSVFLEQQQQQGQRMTVDEMIREYATLVSDWLSKHSLTESDMIETFGTVRDEWIQDDFRSWKDINSFYPGVPAALEHLGGGTPSYSSSGNNNKKTKKKEAYLVTTKQQRFAIALCRHAGISPEALPDENVYGLGQYKSKADVIVDRMNRGGHSPHQTLFFEDRWPTLVKCLKDPRLNGVRLHLCAWGYVADWELALAEAEPRVEVLDLNGFVDLVYSDATNQPKTNES